MRDWLSVATLLAITCSPSAARAEEIDHGRWNELVARHVRDGRVDYEGAASDRPALDRYLTALAEVQLLALPSHASRLAFWINAYNACVFRGVLDHWPLKSVKDVPGFFDRLRYRVAGRDLTLNAIEHASRALGDWRVHCAVVCASSSCPPIRAEAYTADALETQLSEQVSTFLANARDGLRSEGSTLWVSSIFRWYAKDFVKGRMTSAALLDVLEPYLPEDVRSTVRTRRLTMRALPYDWSLNAR